MPGSKENHGASVNPKTGDNCAVDDSTATFEHEDDKRKVDLESALQQSVFLKACRLEPTQYTPVWLMRQAGRYQPEFRELRSRVGFLELCKNPELASEVTIKAVEQLNVDAAIIFADILLPLDALGAGLSFVKGEGPHIAKPVRTAQDVEQLPFVDVEDCLHYVLEAITRTRRELRPNIPLIGFAGAPFTLASYLIEGGSSKNYENAKRLMYADGPGWSNLMTKIVDLTVTYLVAQVNAGAQALQVFDSWVGCLSADDYKEYVLPHCSRLFEEVRRRTDVPLIYFGTGTTSLLELMSSTKANVIGLDWRVDIASGWDRVGNVAVQGNLDPCVLLADRDTVRKQTVRILDRVGAKPGHIFNLGHGVLPETSVDNVKYLVDLVHEKTKR